MTTTGNPDADVNVGELVEANDEERLVELGAQDLGAKRGRGSAALTLTEALAVADSLSDRWKDKYVRSNVLHVCHEL